MSAASANPTTHLSTSKTSDGITACLTPAHTRMLASKNLRPARKIKPSAALLEHSEKAALPSQTKAINAFCAAEAAKHGSNNPQPTNSPSPPAPEPTVPAPTNKRSRTKDAEEGYEPSDEERENAQTNPKCKLSNLLDNVLVCAEKVFKQRYDELHQDRVLSQPTTTKSKVSGLKKLIREVQSDSEDDAEPEPGATSTSDPSKPWRAEFTSYIETIEVVQSAGMSTIQWWGINGQRYPVWASLARD
ncbi:hypothetical protein P692DRAFT_201866624 [Suillus brevipes Sb2]|nr:hypothetical protein P692DRAFT_201866624 [Suillus brevipes Sb2]